MVAPKRSNDASKQETKSSSQQTSQKSSKSKNDSSHEHKSSSSSSNLTDTQMESKINDALSNGLEEEHANDPDGWGKYISKMQYLNASQGLEGVNIYLNADGMELSKAQGYEIAKQAKNAADGYLSTINVNDNEQKQIFKYLSMDPSDGKTTTQAHLVTRDGDSIASTSPLKNNQFKEKDFMK